MKNANSANFIISCLVIICLSLPTGVSAAYFTIIESQSMMPGHDMDVIWEEIITNMQHQASIVPQTTLDNNAFFQTTDVLIVSSGTIELPDYRIDTIIEFLETGKPVYLQTEYQVTYTTNMAYENMVNSLGGYFNWISTTSGTLEPMYVLGCLSCVYNDIVSFNEFWYGCCGEGDQTIDRFLFHEGEHFGFIFCPPSNNIGHLITTSDQDWIRDRTCDELMENIISHTLLFDEPDDLEVEITPLNPPILIPASGGSLNYDVSAENVGINDALFDCWCTAELLGDTTYGPFQLKLNLFLEGGAIRISPSREQIVPAAAPQGEYEYSLYLGDYPDLVVTSDSFIFEKLEETSDQLETGSIEFAFEDNLVKTENSPSEIHQEQDMCSNKGTSRQSEDPAATPHKSLLTSGSNDFRAKSGTEPVISGIYPNPFNRTCTVTYNLQSAGDVSISVFNITGREIDNLIKGYQNAGMHRVSWNAEGNSSGIYWVKLESENNRDAVLKILYIK